MGPEVAFTTRCARATLWIEIPCSKLSVRTESKILKKSLETFSAIFQTWKFFSKLQQQVPYKWKFFRFGYKSYSILPVYMFAAYHEKSFVVLLTMDLSNNLESGKRNYCLGKRSGKSIEFIFWCMRKGVFTWHPGDFRPGASSLRFPLMALYLFTWYHHKMSCRRESPRREFTPVVVPGREFHSGTKSRNGIM